MIFLNFKSSIEGTGKNALRLLEIVSNPVYLGIPVIPVVHDFDLYPARKVFPGQLWIQNMDFEYGGTGKNSPETVVNLQLKVGGTFLNHSENKFPDNEKLGNLITKCRSLGIKTLVFASSLDELSSLSLTNPDFLSYEPPELIGSKSTSVAQDQPDIIAKAVEITKKANIPLIVGAGIHSRQDVETSLAFGAVGVAVSSDIVKAGDPGEELFDLSQGFNRL